MRVISPRRDRKIKLPLLLNTSELKYLFCLSLLSTYVLTLYSFDQFCFVIATKSNEYHPKTAARVTLVRQIRSLSRLKLIVATVLPNDDTESQLEVKVANFNTTSPSYRTSYLAMLT